MVEILKIFSMMDYKYMTTPTEANMKKLSDSASDLDLMDPTI